MRFYISDFHFGHKNIIQYCDRPYQTVDLMDHDMIKRWNDVVTPEDEVFVVGDFSFYPVGRTEEIARSLNGTKHLVLGNHDMHRGKTYWRRLFATVDDSKDVFLDEIGRTITLSHYPAYGPAAPQILVHGHSHNNRPVLTTYITTRQLLVNVSVEGLEYTPLSESKLIAMIQQHEDFFNMEAAYV